MNVIRYRPWSRVAHRGDDIRQVFDRFFGDVGSNANSDANSDVGKPAEAQWTPRVDIREEQGRFLILADVPGVDPASIEIDMDGGVLSIRGERPVAEIAEGERLTRTERQHGAFHRRFTLPDSADAEGIVATGKHGVLEIVIPKRAETRSRRIPVNA
ncbi:MAG: Hsp20/alpha crystallin family protein [Lysobacteraceae bacterium]